MITKENKRDIVIARLIANTLKKKRPNNLIEIANDIRWLENDLGTLKAVSEIIRISTEMLKRFLSVEQLCPEVHKLVEDRKIDLINIVHYMRNFNPEAQKIIAREVLAERLSGDDIRILAPLQKVFPQWTGYQLISHIQRSKNIKIYIAYFRIPQGSDDYQKLKHRFEKIVGETEIVTFTIKDLIGVLELTSSGKKRLKEAAKERNLSLRKFLDKIVLE